MRNNSDSDSQYRGSRLLNGILAVGIFITIAGIFLLITFPAGMTLQPAVLRALITLVAGGLIIYYTFAVSRKSWMLCTGLFLFLTGILLLLIDAHIISYSIGKFVFCCLECTGPTGSGRVLRFLRWLLFCWEYCSCCFHWILLRHRCRRL